VEVVIDNSLIEYLLRIVKIDALTEEVIPGAVFGIYFDEDGEVPVDEENYTTDENGEIEIMLVPGTYYVIELTAPEGYVLDSTPLQVVVSENTAVDGVVEVVIDNSLIEYLLRIVKVDENTEEVIEGAVFGIYTDMAGTMPVDEENYTTDENGEIEIMLVPGTYYVIELTAPEGYVLDSTPLEVVVSENTAVEGVVEVVIDNSLIEYLLRIVKIDALTEEVIPGAVFGIYFDEDGEVPVDEENYTTDENGIIEITLNAGTYYIIELEAPADYVLDSTPWEVVVSENTAVEGVVEVVIANTSDDEEDDEDEEYLLRIKKIDALTGNPLQGAVFTIYKDEALTTLFGEAEYTTNINGIIEVLLPEGTYYVLEITAPAGYVEPEGGFTPMTVLVNENTADAEGVVEIIVTNAADEEEDDEDEEPDTATGSFNLLIGGFLLLIISGAILYLQKRKMINS